MNAVQLRILSTLILVSLCAGGSSGGRAGALAEWAIRGNPEHLRGSSSIQPDRE
jgi:hypothetical protein